MSKENETFLNECKSNVAIDVDNGSELVSLNVMTWNILADALATDELVTLGGDSENVAWNGNRDVKIGKILTESFINHDMSIVATHENDHPQWLLEEIRKSVPSVDMCILSQGNNDDLPTKYERCYVRRLSHAIVMLDEENDSICPVQCNGETPGCSSKAAKTSSCLRQHYQASNNWFKSADVTTRRALCQKGITCTTNAQEEIATTGNDDINGDDLYIPSAAGTVIYFDTSKVNMLHHQSEHDCVDFKTKVSGVPFTIFAAHLKSGVNLKAEKRRCKQLHKLLSHAHTSLNPIVLMDANSCLQYQQDLQKSMLSVKEDDTKLHEWTTDVIKKYSFVNLVPNEGNECLKLRQYGTDQTEKAGQFMFDTIDKILVRVAPSSSTSVDNNTNSFSSNFLQILSTDTYPSEYYDDYVKLRNTPYLRDALKQMGSDQYWGTDLTPFLLNMKETFATHIKHVCDKESIENNVALEHDISDLISHLFPNSIPSDHPPVGATVVLEHSKLKDTSLVNVENNTPIKAENDRCISKDTTTPMSQKKPSVSSDVIGDGSFEALMKERAKLRKEKDEHSIAELRVSLTNTERSLSREIKRRIESQSYIEKLCEEKVAAMEERLHLVMDNHVKGIQDRLEQLDVKVNDLNIRLEEEKATIPADIAKRSKDIKDMLQSFIDEFSVERKDRLNREGRIMKQLTDHAELLSTQWNEERRSREESVSILTEKLDENDRNRSEADANFSSLVEREVEKLREEIDKESKERTIEDDEIVEALNRYTEHLQNSLSVISTVGN